MTWRRVFLAAMVVITVAACGSSGMSSPVGSKHAIDSAPTPPRAERSRLPIAQLIAVAQGELNGLGHPRVKTAFVVATRKNEAESWLEPRAVPPDPANPRAYVVMVRGNFICSSACLGLAPIHAKTAQAIWIPGAGVADGGLGGAAHTLKTLSTLGKVIQVPLTRHPHLARAA